MQNILESCEKIIANPKRYTKKEAAGALRYVKNIDYNPETGEHINSKRVPSLDVNRPAVICQENN